MTRFWWTVEEAADFVLHNIHTPGLHVPDLKGRSVVDIIEERAPGHPTVVIGASDGEKLHERLQTTEENLNSSTSQWSV